MLLYQSIAVLPKQSWYYWLFVDAFDSLNLISTTHVIQTSPNNNLPFSQWSRAYTRVQCIYWTFVALLCTQSFQTSSLNQQPAPFLDRLFKNRFPWQVGFFKKYINVAYSRTYLNKGNTSSMWPSQDQWPQTAENPWKLMAVPLVPLKGTKKNNIWTNHWFQEISYLALGNPSNLFCSCRYTTEN